MKIYMISRRFTIDGIIIIVHILLSLMVVDLGNYGIFLFNFLKKSYLGMMYNILLFGNYIDLLIYN